MDYICRKLAVKTNIRMQTRKKPITDDTEIRIYERLPKNLFISLLCLMFAVGGIFILRDDSAGTPVSIKDNNAETNNCFLIIPLS